MEKTENRRGRLWHRKGWLAFALLLCLCTSLLGCSGTLDGTGAKRQEEQTAASVSGQLSLHFLDVGEGNAVLLENDGHYMLVDGGVNKMSSYVVAYLKKTGVKTLDYVVASHYDADHLAGLVGALHVFSVKRVLGPDYEADTKIYDSFLSALKEQKLEIEHPRLGDQYSFGAASFTIEGPVEYGHSDENEDSLALRLVFGNTSFLLAGDAGAESEEEMLEEGVTLDSDVYLANHHGSDTSTSQEFLDAVDPDYVVISSGTDGNDYGHPKAAVLDRISSRSVPLYRTDMQGEVLAISDGKQITFLEDPCNDFTPGNEAKDASREKAAKEEAKKAREEKEAEGTEKKAQQEKAAKDGKLTASGAKKGGEETQTYILNTSTRKFHKETCRSLSQMKEENKEVYQGSRQEILEMGYDACGNCKP